jgi:hypothetical protein
MAGHDYLNAEQVGPGPPAALLWRQPQPPARGACRGSLPSPCPGLGPARVRARLLIGVPPPLPPTLQVKAISEQDWSICADGTTKHPGAVKGAVDEFFGQLNLQVLVTYGDGPWVSWVVRKPGLSMARRRRMAEGAAGVLHAGAGVGGQP